MDNCKQCAAPLQPINAITVAFVVIFAIIIICYLTKCKRKEKFTSQQASKIYDLFNQTKGDITYSEFKVSIDNADPVLYTDARELWRNKQLSIENIQRIL